MIICTKNNNTKIFSNLFLHLKIIKINKAYKVNNNQYRISSIIYKFKINKIKI